MQLKKYIVSMFLFLLFAIASLSAQENILQGRVVDASSGAAVEFANLGILNTFVGDATDNEGFFRLSVPDEALNNIVRISAVGYISKEIKITELLKLQDIEIKLYPAVYNIDEVDVEAPSRVLYGMLKMVTQNISENYYNGNYRAQLVYKENTIQGSRILDVDYADLAGYGVRTRKNAFERRLFKLVGGTRNFEYFPFEGGMHQIGDLLEFDIVRNPGNILDNAFVDGFDVYEKDQYTNEGKKIIVIGFKNDNPASEFSGDPRVTNIEGEIHVILENMSVLKVRTTYFTHGWFRHGRSFLTDETVSNALIPVNQYNVSAEYDGTIDGKKVISRIGMEMQQTETKNSSFELLFNEFNPGQESENISGRQYYDNVSVNSENFYTR